MIASIREIHDLIQININNTLHHTQCMQYMHVHTIIVFGMYMPGELGGGADTPSRQRHIMRRQGY
jgi:hypothetical protein